jgi:peptidyl-prolyl cis-trans isomerase SurA
MYIKYILNCSFLITITFGVITNSIAEKNTDETSTPVVIDMVIATVDNDPITLSQLAKALNKNIKYEEFIQDKQLQQNVESLIQRKVVEKEAKKANISVNEKEVMAQLEAVASQNQLSIKEFKDALAQEGQDFQNLAEEIKFQLMRSKLLGKVVREEVIIKESDIDEFIKTKYPDSNGSDSNGSDSEVGSRLELAQIFLDSEISASEDGKSLKSRISEIKKLIKQGVPFEDIARRFSDSPEGANGGKLGAVVVSELDPEVREVIDSLAINQISDPVTTSTGVHFFKVYHRIEGDPKNDVKIRALAKQALEKKEFDEQYIHFIEERLEKDHIIERNFKDVIIQP